MLLPASPSEVLYHAVGGHVCLASLKPRSQKEEEASTKIKQADTDETSATVDALCAFALPYARSVIARKDCEKVRPCVADLTVAFLHVAIIPPGP